ncbi:MAG: hypothetical protein R3D71_07210 [Rickettsiales bacterium]
MTIKLKAKWILPLISILLLTNSCGFKPVYSKKNNSIPEDSPISSGVVVSASAGGVISLSNNSSIDHSSYTSMARQFTNNLEDMLPSVNDPKYKLEVSIVQSRSGIGVARDGTASRYNLIINSSYNLIRITDNKIIDSGSVSNVTSYNNPNNQYFSTYISEQDARKRGIKEHAELYRHRMMTMIKKQDSEDKSSIEKYIQKQNENNR